MCWNNFIGIDSTCSPASESGFYMSDIGINKRELDLLIGPEFASGQELAQNRVIFAAKSIQNVLNTTSKRKFRQTSLLQNTRIGVFQDNLIQDAAIANTLKGIQLEFCEKDAYYNLNFTSVSLQVNFTGAVDVLVYDLLDNQLLDTIPVEVTAGVISRVSLNKVYKGNKQKMNLFVGYLSSFPSYRSNVSQDSCSSCSGNHWKYSSRYVRNQAGTIDNSLTKIDRNVKSSNSTGGLSVEYNVSCDYDNWICSVKNSVSLPILYKAGELIMDYGLQQEQWNSKTGIRRQDLERRRNDYRDKYHANMEGVLNEMNMPKNICFPCDGPVRTQITLP